MYLLQADLASLNPLLPPSLKQNVGGVVEEAPGESKFQVASLVAEKMRNGEGRLRAGSRAHPSWATPPPLVHAGQGRDLRAGPQKGGGATLATQGACGWAQNASLSATQRATAPQQRWVPAAAFAPPLQPTPLPPCPTSPVPGRCAAARISTSSSRRWVSWYREYVRSVRSSCEAPGSQRGWPG